MEAPKLDELALRRPTFLGGVPVTLADGQDWTIPVPEMRLRLDRTAPEGLQFCFGFGGEVDPEFSRLRREYEDAEGLESLRIEMRLMDLSLSKNYELSDDAAATLLDFAVGKGIMDEAREAVLNVLWGIDVEKKHSSGGSDLL